MRKNIIGIPIVLISIAIMVFIALSGNLVYKSISEILDSWDDEMNPDRKMVMIKGLIADIDNLENSVKLYSFSGNKIYFNDYQSVKIRLEEELSILKKYPVIDTVDRKIIDSLIVLSDERIKLWNQIIGLYLSKTDEHIVFEEYSKRMNTMLVETDTIHFPKSEKLQSNNETISVSEEKNQEDISAEKTFVQDDKKRKGGFFRRLFSKKEEIKEEVGEVKIKEAEKIRQPDTHQTVIVDRSSEKEALQKEIKKLETEIILKNKMISEKSAFLMQENLKIKETIAELTLKLEDREIQNEHKKSEEANLLATQTYQRLIYFAITVFLFLILVLIIIFRDLRRSRRHQAALQKAKENAEQLAQAKKIFTATVSHEMRTPVNVIHGLSEQLLQQKFNKIDRKNIEVIYQSSEQLNNLVNSTFDLTRIENQHIYLQPVNFSLDNLLERIEIYNKQIAADKGIDLLIDKESTPGLILFEDEKRLEQVINNLINNALKFTNEGFVCLKTSKKTIENKEWLIFKISDTGIGISEDDINSIFNDFVQLETDENKQAGGTGLGLYIAKKITELLGGSISAKSKIGEGSIFKVKIPFREGNQGEIKTSIESYPCPKALKEGKVLVVDDEEFNRYLLKTILEKWDVTFDEASDGNQAIKLSKRNDYLLIMMDIRMPGINGIETAKTINETGSKTKIIALSANNSNFENSTYFDAFLEKPFNEAGLFSVIEKTLQDAPANIFAKKSSDNCLIPKLQDLMLMANGDKVFLKEMIEIFINSSQCDIGLMQQNIQEKNYQAIADIAHKMASPLKHMNIMEVYKTIKCIEKAAESSDYNNIETIFCKLETQLETVNNHLRLLSNNSSE